MDFKSGKLEMLNESMCEESFKGRCSLVRKSDVIKDQRRPNFSSSFFHRGLKVIDKKLLEGMGQ
jgi:hypothetical protein